MAAAAPVASPLLDFFSALSTLDVSARASASAALVRALRASQAAFDDATARAGALAPSPAARPCCNDVAYAVGRLVRGLSSPRPGARQGYVLALTEVLQRFPNVRSADVVVSLLKATVPVSGTAKSEVRDMLLGRAFGAAALARAGRLRVSAADAAPDSDAVRAVASLVPDLLALGDRKPWLTALVGEVVCAALAGIDDSGWRAAWAEALLPRLSAAAATWSPEALSIALELDAAAARWPAAAARPEPTLRLRAALETLALPGGGGGRGVGGSVEGSANAENGEGVSFLTNAVRESTRNFPVVHGVLTRLFARFVGGVLALPGGADAGQSPAPSASSLTSISAFEGAWRAIVDESLLAAGNARRATALALFSSLVEGAAAGSNPARALTAMLSRPLLGALVTGGLRGRHPLAAPSRTALAALVAACAGRAAAASAALLALLSRTTTSRSAVAGNDRAVFGPTATSLMAELDDAALRAHMLMLVRSFVAPPVNAVNAQLEKNAAAGGAPLQSDSDDDEIMTAARASDSAARSFAGGDGAHSGKGGKKRSRAAGSGVDAADEATDLDALLLRNEAAAIDSLPAADASRVALLDSLSGTLRAPGLRVLHDPAFLLPLISVISFHSVAGLDARASPATISSLASRLGVDALVAVDSGAVPTAAAVASLLVASPPLSPTGSAIIRSRLTSLLHSLVSAAATTSSGFSLRKSAEAADAGDGENDAAADAAGDAGASVETGLTALDREERAAATAGLGYDLAAVGNSAFDAAVAERCKLSVSLEALNASSSAPFAADDDDDDDDDEPIDDDGDARAPYAMRADALAVAASLRTLSKALSEAAAGGFIVQVSAMESARQACAVASLLSLASLKMVHDAAGGAREARETGNALVDIVATLPTTLADVIATAKRAADSLADGKKPARALSRSLRTGVDSILHAAAAAAADDGEGTGGGSPATTAARHRAVFVDALLALLANAGAALRDVVKAAARAGFSSGVTADSLQPVLDLIASSAGDEVGLGGGDASDDEGVVSDGAGSDAAASIQLRDDDDGDGDDSAGVAAAQKSKKKESKMDARDTAPKRARRASASSQSATDSEDDDHASDAAAEMERYDRALENIVRLKRETAHAGRDARARALAFRSRALDLFAVALARVATPPADAPTPHAHPALFTLLAPALSALSRMASRAKAKSAAGREAVAADWARLASRLGSSISRAAKAARVPALSTAGASWVAAGVTPASQLALLSALESIARRAPTPAVVDVATVAANLVLRTLRDAVPPTPSTGNSSSSTPAQPPAALVPSIVAVYARGIDELITAKHPRTTAAFFRNVFSTVPSVSVALLPGIARALTARRVPRAFRVADAYAHALAILHAAGSPWARDLPSVTTALRAAAAPLAAAIAHTLRVSADEARTRGTAAAAGKKDAAAPAVDSNFAGAVAPKALRDPLEILRMLAKAGVLGDGPDARAAVELAKGVAADKSHPAKKFAGKAVAAAAGGAAATAEEEV